MIAMEPDEHECCRCGIVDPLATAFEGVTLCGVCIKHPDLYEVLERMRREMEAERGR